jgi:hypothetical protein
LAWIAIHTAVGAIMADGPAQNNSTEVKKKKKRRTRKMPLRLPTKKPKESRRKRSARRKNARKLSMLFRQIFLPYGHPTLYNGLHSLQTTITDKGFWKSLKIHLFFLHSFIVIILYSDLFFEELYLYSRT